MVMLMAYFCNILHIAAGWCFCCSRIFFVDVFCSLGLARDGRVGFGCGGWTAIFRGGFLASLPGLLCFYRWFSCWWCCFWVRGYVCVIGLMIWINVEAIIFVGVKEGKGKENKQIREK